MGVRAGHNFLRKGSAEETRGTAAGILEKLVRASEKPWTGLREN